MKLLTYLFTISTDNRDPDLITRCLRILVSVEIVSWHSYWIEEVKYNRRNIFKITPYNAYTTSIIWEEIYGIHERVNCFRQESALLFFKNSSLKMKICVFEIVLQEDMLFRKGEVLTHYKISVHIKSEIDIFRLLICDIKYITKHMYFFKKQNLFWKDV